MRLHFGDHMGSTLPEPSASVILFILIKCFALVWLFPSHNYLRGGCNVTILLLVTNQGQITISIDIAYKLLHQLLYNSIEMPLPKSLKNIKEQKPSTISVQNPPAQHCSSDFLPQWHFLELQVIYCLYGDS